MREKSRKRIVHIVEIMTRRRLFSVAHRTWVPRIQSEHGQVVEAVFNGGGRKGYSRWVVDHRLSFSTPADCITMIESHADGQSFFTQHFLAHFLPLCLRLFLVLGALRINRSLLPVSLFLCGVPDYKKKDLRVSHCDYHRSPPGSRFEHYAGVIGDLDILDLSDLDHSFNLLT